MWLNQITWVLLCVALAWQHPQLCDTHLLLVGAVTDLWPHTLGFPPRSALFETCCVVIAAQSRKLIQSCSTNWLGLFKYNLGPGRGFPLLQGDA